MKHVCIHGHFYQPPRANPWTGRIDRQPSAAPFPDWNHRVTDECYRPNCAATVLDGKGFIVEHRLNYAEISFDFGPTLLSWMEDRAPDVYASVLEADRRSLRRWGHGNAMAQGYHHAILPLCNDRDRRTEVLWGIADFRQRFQRHPEGLWMPETAVDLATLDLMAEQGIRFTLLAPRQVQGKVAPGRPYRVALPSGRSIAVFVYDGPLSQGVAFEGLLHDGARFARRIADSASEGQLAHLATDGESYGHHHRHGEMALAFCLRSLDEREDLTLTNYGRFLAEHPPTQEVAIVEGSSWSCAHGLGRWSRDCGCTMDPGRSGQHAWRAVLRRGLEWLRDSVGALVELEGAWEARDHYIEQPDGSPLMEMERHALAMFTSCGWFFDDPAGLEPIQNLRHALRAIQLHTELTGRSLEGEFVDRIEPMWPEGRVVWHEQVVAAGSTSS